MKKAKLKGVATTKNFRKGESKDDENDYVCTACNGAHRAHHPKCPKSRHYKHAQIEKNRGSLTKFFCLPKKNSNSYTESNSQSNRKDSSPSLVSAPNKTPTVAKASFEPSPSKPNRVVGKVNNPYLKNYLRHWHHHRNPINVPTRHQNYL